MSQNDDISLSNLANQVKENADATTNILESLTETLKKSGKDGSSGLTFLDVKNFLLLDYMSNITYLMLKKSFGKRVEGDPSIERLVENRTVLEKMRPIEKKLKYQIDKYLKVADNGYIPENDPLHFKPNLDALDQDLDEDDSNEDEDGERTKGGFRKYVAPRHVPAYFDDNDPTNLEKDESAKREKRMLSKGLIEELKRQHLDTPEEEYNLEAIKQSRQAAIDRERTRFEEENFIRLPVTKQDKKDRRKRQLGLTMGRLGDELTHDFGKSNFGDSTPGTAKKRKKSSKKSSSKKKFKRRC